MAAIGIDRSRLSISMHLNVPVTTRQAQLLTDLWNHYYAAALAYYDAK